MTTENQAAAGAAFRSYLERRRTQPRLANARSVRTLWKRARLRRANRLVSGPVRRLTRTERIEAEGILNSRVFGPSPGGGRRRGDDVAQWTSVRG
ncbi:MAG: hypothetical protein ACRDY7_14565 [Acidimicrobiia bacterium]